MLALFTFSNGIGIESGGVRAFARDEARKGGSVVRENLGGGDVVVEGEAEFTGFLVG